jgi:hypothetical protein
VDRFRVSATGRGPNYLPEFVADDLGFFAQEDLLVERCVPAPWDGVLDDLASGRADVVARHAMRNAMIPVVTVVGLSLPVLISGAAITEARASSSTPRIASALATRASCSGSCCLRQFRPSSWPRPSVSGSPS